ncbi:aspartate carbamoyltransferase [Candidatus Desantisbacteria bacterium CG2_30_40_21]|uniref:Aspartate carbamoyltransferase n=5 Tax=unclassified Candidatus Desantisiibacteriota TaxID=3106372 RepID=A0A2M7JB45_9BACT|nr:MAG: aspartate carbamoyltransferase [Candidatus Desantisbacteria bacterium CG2_30_40_21]PIP41654.1 MAG: aspartate carbamoyltransferase [Candidatus Desantisbacteria bacterium CG23_combo_of_CG06-09_8_20_14_all_40_23]PIX16626.1 MAG: aspartate carbamoyltransferase [Candidatus Desantisbacteria bacterium CG_4_8_14_3_um_filter_40_12]PIY18898.1 MAG: aspartate carbamoyltransferase [Candidatus Desantisbacteria bacterium CG_4_10_14_3_um_filter_40_18]PJB28445.1 MAG: aspartate carbamoyltransferase [Candi
MHFSHHHLLSIQELTAEDITRIMDTAASFKEVSNREVKRVPTLRGHTIVNLFYEPSTRTRISFEIAAKRLSADVLNVAIASSSVVKGESLKDTVKTIEAMQPSIIVIRHAEAGVPQMVSRLINCSVINAGDGSHEHPTQGLLDMFTIREKKGRLDGLRVAIIGDILHSRVARSNIWGLIKMGARVVLCGPPTLMPIGIEKLGVEITYNLLEAVRDADVIMLLRLQLERQKTSMFPTIREYAEFYGLQESHLQAAKSDVLIMHPGPINRDIEISGAIADGQHSCILEQVTNGIAVRMAVLYLVSMGNVHTVAQASSL